MKKWMYLIAPAIMMGVFMVFYFSYVEKAHAKEAAAKARVEAEKKSAFVDLGRWSQSGRSDELGGSNDTNGSNEP